MNHSGSRLECQEVTFSLLNNPTFDRHHDLDIKISAEILTKNIAMDPNSAHTVSRKIRFDKDCGQDNICQAELSLTANIDASEVIFGTDINAEITAVLNVQGENSYGTILYIQSTSKFLRRV